MLDRAGRPDTAGPEPGGRPRGKGWLPGAEERYRALSEQIPAVLYSEVHTPEGAILYESPQNQELLGYTAEETMQPDFWKSLVHPDDRERVLAENERVDATGDPWHMEYRVFTKDGRVMWIRDHAVLVRGEHGEPDYWQGYYIDITEPEAGRGGAAPGTGPRAPGAGARAAGRQGAAGARRDEEHLPGCGLP